MKKNKIILASVSIFLFSAVLFFAHHFWSNRNVPSRTELLSLLPGDGDAIFYADVSALRQAPFVAQMIAWAPKPQADADYAQFVRDTGFDYERDLDHIAIAGYKNKYHSTFYAVATGRFEQAKIAAYAVAHGKYYLDSKNRRVFVVPSSESPQEIMFTFLRDNEIVITNDNSGIEKFRYLTLPAPELADWQPRLDRLSGSPVFAIIRQKAATGDALAAQAPGGLRSPQLSALLNQLEWITVAGIPAGDTLRVVSECESSEDAISRQLADMLNGVIILAQAGLNDPKTRRQLAPDLRQAYLDLLNSAQIARIDRNQTKSVRIIFDLTPKFLEAAKSATPQPPPPAIRTQPSTKSSPRN